MATRACHGPSAGSGWPSCRSAAPSSPCGSRSPDSGNEAAATFSPASSGGSTDSSDTAVSGSDVVASSQRPSHPVLLAVAGDAVCQMAIERKWLRSGCGYPTPRTMASDPLSHSALRPFMPGFRPSPSPRSSTSSGR